MEKYRFDLAYGKLYEYDDDAQAYIFVMMTTYAKTLQEAIKEYEDWD